MTRVHAGIDLDDLLGLWETPPGRRTHAERDFAALYADPVVINDRPTAVADLVVRAEAVHAAFTAQVTEVLEVVTERNRIAFAFRREATWSGPWVTPLGELSPTGERVTLTGMDILTIESGRVVAIRVLADDLAVLLQASRTQRDSSR